MTTIVPDRDPLAGFQPRVTVPLFEEPGRVFEVERHTFAAQHAHLSGGSRTAIASDSVDRTNGVAVAVCCRGDTSRNTCKSGHAKEQTLNQTLQRPEPAPP
jgi:hypothetical protein